MREVFGEHEYVLHVQKDKQLTIDQLTMRKCLNVYKIYHEYFPTSHPPSWLFPSLLETSLPCKSELMVQPDIAGYIYVKLSDTSDIRLKLIKFVHGIFENKNILKRFLLAFCFLNKPQVKSS